VNKNYTRYASRTGMILGVIDIPDNDEFYDLHSTLLFDGLLNSQTHYIANGEPTERPIMYVGADKDTIRADGVDCITITGIEEGAVINVTGPVDGISTKKDDTDVLTISATVPGTYYLSIELFPYLPVAVEYRAY
jgi:hypothetical protein